MIPKGYISPDGARALRMLVTHLAPPRPRAVMRGRRAFRGILEIDVGLRALPQRGAITAQHVPVLTSGRVLKLKLKGRNNSRHNE